jgi:hypothetical protein
VARPGGGDSGCDKDGDLNGILSPFGKNPLFDHAYSGGEGISSACILGQMAMSAEH